MAKCYHKACDVWDPESRSPDSPRFLATVTQAVLESVLEMAEEEIIQEAPVQEENVAEEEVVNKNVIKKDVIKQDVTKKDVINEQKEKVMEEKVIEEKVMEEKEIKETTIQTVESLEDSSISARGSEVQGILPRKAFSRDIFGANNKITT